jgi:hypothetical protein
MRSIVIHSTRGDKSSRSGRRVAVAVAAETRHEELDVEELES